jgi:hypothetical protein
MAYAFPAGGGLPTLGTPGQVLSAGAAAPYYAGIQNTMFFQDDFLYAAYNGSAQGIWNQNSNGGGSGVANINGIASHPGIAELTAASTGFASLQTSRFALLFGSGPIYFDMLVMIPTLSNGTNRFNVVIGFNDAFNVEGSANGAYITYSDSVNSGKWLYNTMNASTASTTDSGLTVVGATWYHLNITVNSAASSVSFSINGANTQTIATNIPTANPVRVTFGLNESVGTGSVKLDVDAFSLLQIFASNRYT